MRYTLCTAAFSTELNAAFEIFSFFGSQRLTHKTNVQETMDLARDTQEILRASRLALARCMCVRSQFAHNVYEKRYAHYYYDDSDFD